MTAIPPLLEFYLTIHVAKNIPPSFRKLFFKELRSVWGQVGKVGKVEPSYIVLPLTVEASFMPR